MIPTAPFPLPTVWCTDLPWFFLAIYAPIVSAERVVIRCGEKMVSLRPGDGSTEWETVVDPESGNGALFLAHKDLFVTEKARLPDCLATLLAVDTTGKEIWRTDLSTMVALGGVAVVDDTLLALSLGSLQDTLLYKIDLATGAIQTQVVLRWPADALVPAAHGLVARNHDASGYLPGLYHMNTDGSDPTPILRDPVRHLTREDELLLLISQATPLSPPAVRVHDAETLAPLWSCEARTEAAALDGGEVFHVADGDGESREHGVLVCRDARTGEPRWRSAALPAKITAISVGGPVVICNHRKGQVLYRRANGALLGEVRGSYGPPAVAGSRMYICRPRAMLCTSLEALY